jgi:hypothetical protein
MLGANVMLAQLGFDVPCAILEFGGKHSGDSLPPRPMSQQAINRQHR